MKLNQRTAGLLDALAAHSDDLHIAHTEIAGGGSVWDFGVDAPGSLDAGLRLAEICAAELATARVLPGEIDGIGWPLIQFTTDHPAAACLLSQYAGWQISVEKFFGMGSGPMRAAAAREELFETLNYRESADRVSGVLEAGRLPGRDVVEFVAERCHVSPAGVTLCVAPTSSLAGTVQVVARSVETAMHKLFELKFDVNRIVAGYGVAPLSPVAADDLTGIGRTNDAILYGGRVTLWVRGDDDTLAEIGPRVPAVSSPVYGQPFLEIFEAAGRDFYKIDPQLFSPAQVTFHNIDTGRVHHFGRIAPNVLRKSFGLA